ncbi:hypothetical protein BC830DRAFT_1084034 [Chytriomyces sp. MP71]|nr:hypothetical protein BC830DRAFT_1084034 [Chytriomyces sp. MP71]
MSSQSSIFHSILQIPKADRWVTHSAEVMGARAGGVPANEDITKYIRHCCRDGGAAQIGAQRLRFVGTITTKPQLHGHFGQSVAFCQAGQQRFVRRDCWTARPPKV